MRHDRHFVEELGEQSAVGVGVMIPVERIETNREQPRSNLGDISELSASIRQRGVLEPLIVRRLASAGSYQLIAGERRLHAAIQAGLSEVPCIEYEATDQEALELALIENLQRKDLSAFEEAEGYRTLAEKYGYTHARISEAIGKSRTTVTEALKLLAIPPAIRDLCRHADITAKSVLLLIARCPSIDDMERLVQEIAESGLDRETARLAAALGEAAHGQAIQPYPQADGEGRDPAPPFRPLNLRIRLAPDAPVRLSLSIRRPGVSRDEVIATLEEILLKLRAGDLDEKLSAQARTP
jgi:ParB family chromosome partitioning protein